MAPELYEEDYPVALGAAARPGMGYLTRVSSRKSPGRSHDILTQLAPLDTPGGGVQHASRVI